MKRNFIRISKEEAELLLEILPYGECTPDVYELYSKIEDFVKNGF